MKKLLFVLAAFTLSIGVMAQGNGKGKGQQKQGKKYGKAHQSKGYDDDRYENNQRGNDGIFRSNDQQGNNNGKYTNNAPRKVRDAFYRDYPNAGNVSWTKDRGVWTARFNGGGIFGGGNSVSYKANGQRIGSSNNNTVYRRDTDRNTDRNTQRRSGTTVWEKIRERKQ